MKKKLLIITIFIFSCTNFFAQDIHFSQPFNTPMLTNPALTGAFKANHRIIANYKGQWNSVTKAYMTYGISYDFSFLKRKIDRSYLSIGLQCFNDQSGIIKFGQTQINLSVAYHLNVNAHNVLAAGIQGGWQERRLKKEQMIFGSQYDPNAPGGYNPALNSGESMPFANINIGDFSAGILWHYNSRKSTVNTPETKKVTVGIAMFHINRPKQTFSSLLTDKMYMKFGFHGNSQIGFKHSNFFIQPAALCFLQGPTSEIIIGNLFGFRLNNTSFYTNYNPETSVAIGAHYRIKDAIIIQGNLEWKNFLLGLSYDITLSKLLNASSTTGSFEISLRYLTPIANSGDKNLY